MIPTASTSTPAVAACSLGYPKKTRGEVTK
jgi:hypothetical protein